MVTYMEENSDGIVRHSAAANIPEISESEGCRLDPEYESANDKFFDSKCFFDSKQEPFATLHEDSVGSCIYACATYENASAPACGGAVFDTVFERGWNNCALPSPEAAADVERVSLPINLALLKME